MSDKFWLILICALLTSITSSELDSQHVWQIALKTRCNILLMTYSRDCYASAEFLDIIFRGCTLECVSFCFTFDFISWEIPCSSYHKIVKNCLILLSFVSLTDFYWSCCYTFLLQASLVCSCICSFCLWQRQPLVKMLWTLYEGEIKWSPGSDIIVCDLSSTWRICSLWRAIIADTGTVLPSMQYGMAALSSNGFLALKHGHFNQPFIIIANVFLSIKPELDLCWDWWMHMGEIVESLSIILQESKLAHPISAWYIFADWVTS